MTTTTTGAPSTGASGRSSSKKATTNGKGKTLKWRKLTLILPSDPPGDLAFSLQDGEISVALRTVFGGEQYQAIRKALADEGLSLQQTIQETDELIGKAFEVWGTDAGE